ncbi:hypothetical protein TTHERM_00519790 (macronuclear) [Tetrahymena thermophila SB210]|uniref:Uncharacterized protein n=1 Tax=Tetrahymena thermophila (strain SB210) TaxID=312017 RepID=I7MIW7_TETTS|nr:hypothetical protein TTHERM_00519790 [Tetrahymena thermophila SB210]EAR95048.3 hypothetical protein TTHERM_00519790 [Tetrahymena thermophila SB210]|eukprot:XP_001015293.3 hypothetical protein TTHERM_00519790 [Tetrahymena thermophila SB210]
MEKQTSAAFSQEFNFKEADEAPDDQFIMKGVYFNAFGAPEHHTNNQAKKKPKKRAFANRIRDQLDQISKLKEQEMNEQIKANNKSDCGNISSGNNNNGNSAQRNPPQNNYTNNSESSDDDSKFITTKVNHLQQSRIQNGGQQNLQMQNSQSPYIKQKQQQLVSQTLNSHPQLKANDFIETNNISTNYNTNYQNTYSKNTFSNIINTPNIVNRNININVSNDSSSSDQEFQEKYKQQNKSKISPIPENPQQKVAAQQPSTQMLLKNQQVGMQTQNNNNNVNKNTQKSSYQVGATCVQNKKNKKRNKSRVLGSSNQSLSSNLQINLQKKNKPFYSVNKSSSSSQQELDDDLEDENETFTQQYMNHQNIQNNNQVYQNNLYQFQQRPNLYNQFRQQQQQQQRSQEQNDTSDLSPCIQPKNQNQQNINSNEYNQQLLDSSIQSVSIKKTIKNSSQSMSAESDIEEEQNKNKFFERKINPFFKSISAQDTNQQSNASQQNLIRNNNKLSNLKIGGQTTDFQNKFTSNNSLQYHINAAANFGNSLLNNQANLSDRKSVAQSPQKQLFDSGIKRSSLPVNNVFNRNSDVCNNGSNYKSNSREDYYQKEKFIKNIDGEQSIITVKIENVSLKPFQTVIAEIVSVERINPQYISYTLKPSQMIHAILKQSYSLQHNTLQVGQQYIFKFHTLESSGSFPIINVNEYIPR